MCYHLRIIEQMETFGANADIAVAFRHELTTHTQCRARFQPPPSGGANGTTVHSGNLGRA